MQAVPMMKVLPRGGEERIHEAVVEILSKVGVVVKEPVALERFHDAGATVDGERVRIRASILERALKTTPQTVTIYDRLGEPAMVLGADGVYFGVHADTPEILDFDTGEVRRYLLSDAGKVAHICDALDSIDFVSQNGFAEDVKNPRVVTALVFAQMMRHTAKPLGVGCYDTDELALVIEAAETVRDGREDLARRPFFYHYSEPTSPLAHSAPSLRRLVMAVERGIPLVYTPMVMAGATGPAGFAGVIAQCLAESLSGIVLAQTIRPGAPCITGGITTVMDMSTTICSYGAPEMSLMVAALTEMAKFYKLPVFGTAGCTDAPTYDAQYACEATFSCLSSALSGAHLVHDVAFLYHAERLSAESLVLADEIIQMVRAFMKGFSLDRDGLCADVIERVGPQGHFLTEPHTLEHFKDVWRPALFDRTIGGQLPNGKSLDGRLHDRAGEILAAHRPTPLEPEADAELARLEERLRGM